LFNSVAHTSLRPELGRALGLKKRLSVPILVPTLEALPTTNCYTEASD
jgi:hypothetical protein